MKVTVLCHSNKWREDFYILLLLELLEFSVESFWLLLICVESFDLKVSGNIDACRKEGGSEWFRRMMGKVSRASFVEIWSKSS